MTETKLLVTVLSVAATLGGWLALSRGARPEPAALPPMPTLVPAGASPQVVPVVRRIHAVTRSSR